MKTQDRLEQIVVKVASRETNFIRINTLGLVVGRVKGDLGKLEIAFDEYRTAFAIRQADHEAFLEREAGRQGTRQLTPTEVEDLEESLRLTLILFLRIDTIYFTAQRLLDGLVTVADTLLRPASVTLGGRHSKLTKRLELVISRGEAPSADQLLPHIEDAQRRITHYRDKYIAHHPYPPKFPEGARTQLRLGAEAFTAVQQTLNLSVVNEIANAWIDYYEEILSERSDTQ